MDFTNYLTATIKVPVRINSEGELIVLDNYAEISIEPLTNEPRETFDSIYEKMIEYVQQNPGYLTCIVDESKSIDNEKPESETLDESICEHIMHIFPYFKKSKKPLNTTFRNKGAKHNFTKKNYD
jgi:hypothetical protein